MASHTSTDAASSAPGRLRLAVIVAVLLVAPLALPVPRAPRAAEAQVYVWRDASGAVRFSAVAR